MEFKLRCPIKEYSKLSFWVEHCNIEGGGPFIVRENKKLKCYDLVSADIIRQVAGPASIEYEHPEYTKYIDSFLQKEKEHYNKIIENEIERTKKENIKDFSLPKIKRIINDYKDKAGAVCGQWHSHVNMGCTPSGTDVNNATLACTALPYLLMLILNKRGEYTLTRFQDGIVKSQQRGVLEIVNDTGIPMTIGHMDDTVRSIRKNLSSFMPSINDGLIDSIRSYLIDNEMIIDKEELKERFKDEYIACKKQVEDSVFDMAHFQINPKTDLIEKREHYFNDITSLEVDEEAYGANMDYIIRKRLPGHKRLSFDL